MASFKTEQEVKAEVEEMEKFSCPVHGREAVGICKECGNVACIKCKHDICYCDWDD